LRFGMMFKLIPERPEFTAYVARLAEPLPWAEKTAVSLSRGRLPPNRSPLR